MGKRMFKHKVAVITGAAQGIGRSIALALAEQGAIVYCLDIQDEENQATADLANVKGEKKCLAIHCDLADPLEINDVFDTIIKIHTTIDILINNAAVFTTISFINDTYEKIWKDYEYNMNVNARGTILCSKKVIGAMASKGSGHIINVNTNHVKRYLYSVSKNEHNYDASKYAQMAFNQSLACELKTYGIRVNAICPAATRTPMLDNFFDPSELPITAERIGKATRIPSLLEPEDVAEAVCGMLCWNKNAPVGKEYLVMFAKDCKKLAKEPVEEYSR